MSTSEIITRTDLMNILNGVLPNLSSTSLQYVGTVNQIHWSSWTATDDGFVLMDIAWLTGGGAGYYYIKDTTDNRYVAKMTTSNANGTSQTRLFPVIKGHTYQQANVEKVDGNYITFHFYKLKAIQNASTPNYVVQEFTSSSGGTYSAFSSGNIEIPITSPSGYKPFAVLGTRSNGDIVVNYPNTYLLNSESTSVIVWIRNPVNSTLTISSVSVGILFVKD